MKRTTYKLRTIWNDGHSATNPIGFDTETEAKAAAKAEFEAKKAAEKKMISEDAEWSGDDFVEQSDALARG